MEFEGLSDSIFKFVICNLILLISKASTHIYQNEIIMTFGYSKTILDFLAKTKNEKDFDVIVVETIDKQGSEMNK